MSGVGTVRRGKITNITLALRDQLQKANRVAEDNLWAAQQRQKQQYDKNAGEREFQMGQSVLVLLPSSTSRILM